MEGVFCNQFNLRKMTKLTNKCTINYLKTCISNVEHKKSQPDF